MAYIEKKKLADGSEIPTGYARVDLRLRIEEVEVIEELSRQAGSPDRGKSGKPEIGWLIAHLVKLGLTLYNPTQDEDYNKMLAYLKNPTDEMIDAIAHLANHEKIRSVFAGITPYLPPNENRENLNSDSTVNQTVNVSDTVKHDLPEHPEAQKAFFDTSLIDISEYEGKEISRNEMIKLLLSMATDPSINEKTLGQYLTTFWRDKKRDKDQIAPTKTQSGIKKAVADLLLFGKRENTWTLKTRPTEEIETGKMEINNSIRG